MKDLVSPREDPRRVLERVRAQAPLAITASVIERIELPVQVHPGAVGATDPLGPAPAAESAQWRELAVDEFWGEDTKLAQWGFPYDGGQVLWLRANVTVPEAWRDDRDNRVLVRFASHRDHDAAPLPAESLAYLDGVELAGFDSEHPWVSLDSAASDATSHTLLLRSTVTHRSRFRGIQLERRSEVLWHYGRTALVALGIVDRLADSSAHKQQLIQGLSESWHVLDLRHGWSSPTALTTAEVALGILTEALRFTEPSAPTIIAAGHGHLDVAWLWPFWRTRQKAVHTVSTALHLMETDPEYHFTMSSPQVWKWIRADAPALWQRMLNFVGTGQLEPVGAFWVESDCNLPSGESLIRQMQAGLSFFESELGQSPTAAWLPDSFGFSAALPQLLRSAGIDVFMTTKLSWNRVNRMPNDTFAWVGQDGSSVLGHFVTASAEEVPHGTDTAWHTYAGNMSPAETEGIWAHYRSKDINNELLYLFGIGDGGGGPTEEMLNDLRVLGVTSLVGNVRPGRADAYFDRLQRRVESDKRLQAWVGDLYLEGHLGTYTSQARMKRTNRDAEWTLKRTELLAAWAAVLGDVSRQPEIDELWETTLRHQFHDVLPGSSIPIVYDDVQRESSAASADADDIASSALETVAGVGDTPLVLNTLGWPRREVIESSSGLRFVEVDGFAVADVEESVVNPAAVVSAQLSGSSWILSNGIVRAVVDSNGEIASLATARGRETVSPAGRANRLVLHEDRPVFWDAWDIDPYYDDKSIPLSEVESIELEQSGPLRAVVRVVRVSDSTRIEQRYRLDITSPRLDIETTVDWQERSMLLRAYFDWDSNAGNAVVGRQFGSIEVPRHRNTSWEQARYEFVAHGFLDVADQGGGVAVLSDAIYGHSVTRAAVGLTLLKSGTWPDPDADTGRHVLRYSVFPHDTGSDGAALARQAAALAQPLEVIAGGAPAPTLVRVVGDGVIADTVKSSWTDNGLVVRVYEARNAPSSAVVHASFAISRAVLCDVRERELRELTVAGDGSVGLELRPHEVATLRLYP